MWGDVYGHIGLLPSVRSQETTTVSWLICGYMHVGQHLVTLEAQSLSWWCTGEGLWWYEMSIQLSSRALVLCTVISRVSFALGINNI